MINVSTFSCKKKHLLRQKPLFSQKAEDLPAKSEEQPQRYFCHPPTAPADAKRNLAAVQHKHS